MLKIVRSQFNKLQQVLPGKPIYEINPTVNESPPQTIQDSTLVSRNLVLESQLLKLKDLINKLQAITTISWTLEWDSSVAMPQLAFEDRAWQIAYLAKLSHEILTSPEMANVLKYFEETNCTMLPRYEQALLHEMRSQYNRGKNVPSLLLEELAFTSVKAQDVWLKAYKADDFSILVPELEKIVSIKRKIAEHIGYKGSPYNALLEAYEPGMTTEKLDSLFGELKQELIPALRKITSSSHKIDATFLNKFYKVDEQLELSKDLLKHIKFDLSRGRIDQGDNSFSMGILPNDVRLVIYIFEKNISYTIANTLHEGGHGLYDQGFNPDLSKSSLFDASSLGMHESQSRLYETIIGQGLPFWEFYFPKLKERFPEQLKEVSLDQFYKAINKVQTTYIWSEADEVAYNIHIIILYEIEKSLIEGKLSVHDVPDFWSNKIQEYFGTAPPDKACGVFCSHWSSGDFGYLPTYALGNQYAAQIYNTMKKEIPELEKQIASGNMDILNNWLREKIYTYGKTENPIDLILRVTGELPNVKHSLNYIKDKYSKLYKIDL